jgi:hypothetical protein
MEELQTEIKAIQAALQSIRANEPRRSPSPTMLVPRPTPTRSQPVQPTLKSTPYQTTVKAPEDLAAAAERLSRLSSTYLQQLEPSKPPVHSLDEAFQRLEAQAEQVNQLSVEQETAILKLKVIAEQVERDRKATAPSHGSQASIHLPPICEYLDTAIPHVERDPSGGLVLTSRSIDLFQAERDAEFNAEVLRHVVKQKRKPSFLRQLWHWLLEKPQPRKRSTLSSPGQSSRRSRPSFTLRQAVVLLGGAIATRVVLDAVLIAFPGLWFPAITIMAMPAAIAIYRSTLTPESGLLWGVRVALILIGLLIGGRL